MSQCFGKHCHCYLQHSTWLIPKRQSCTLNSSLKNLRAVVTLCLWFIKWYHLFRGQEQTMYICSTLSTLCKCPFLQVCLCPIGLTLNHDKRTCSVPVQCSGSMFKCKADNFCIPSMMRYVVRRWISKAGIHYITLLSKCGIFQTYQAVLGC